MLGVAMYVIGTAGHVDHGKSTLVHALTGIDPDRLLEEKNRGLTIDLGFAWFTLPSGNEVSIVDVPGHERFIKNMLAGVGGIDLALVIVAADESVMPQTLEHLAILDLLNVTRGLVVITKRDLVDDEILQLVHLEIEEIIKTTTLADSPIIPVSATTGEGLPELVDAMSKTLANITPRPNLNRPRLAIDRSFSITGFGTVVTGTLIDGSLKNGQEMELILSGQKVRIRGLQTHRRKVEEVNPGTRVAVNLGGVSPKQISRGELLTTPGWLKASNAVDVQLRLLATAQKALPHNHPVTFHAYTGETIATVRLLDNDALEPGSESWAQIWLNDPLALARGDRFIIRSSDSTLGGGIVIDIHAKRHKRRQAHTISQLEILAQGSNPSRFLKTLEDLEPATVTAIGLKANFSPTEVFQLAHNANKDGALIALGPEELTPKSFLYTRTGWSKLTANARNILVEFHRLNPMRRGIPREELRNRLGLHSGIGAQVFHRLAADGEFVNDAELVRLTAHLIVITPEQRNQMDKFVESLEKEPFGTIPEIDDALLHYLSGEGGVEIATDGVIFAAAYYRTASESIIKFLQSHGTIKVAQVRDMLGTSRKFALALLEHMDAQHVTMRIGDERKLT